MWSTSISPVAKIVREKAGVLTVMMVNYLYHAKKDFVVQRNKTRSNLIFYSSDLRDANNQFFFLFLLFTAEPFVQKYCINRSDDETSHFIYVDVGDRVM